MGFKYGLLFIALFAYIQSHEEVSAAYADLSAYRQPSEYMSDPYRDVPSSFADAADYSYTGQSPSVLNTKVYTSDPVSTPVELYDGRVAEHHKGILATLFSPIKWLIDLILLPFRTIMHFFHL